MILLNNDLNNYFQDKNDNNRVSTINDVLNVNVIKHEDSNNKNSNIDNVVNYNIAEKQNQSISCSYCSCCGRLIDGEGNLLGIDGKNKDILINKFIGKNAEIIKNQSFSISTFLFGSFYFGYRKLYAHSLLVMLFEFFGIPIVSFSLFLKISDNSKIVLYLILLLIFRIFLALKFSNIYLKFVKNEVDFYEKKYNYYLDNILLVCNKKGGTNIFSFILYLVCLIVCIIFWFIVLSFRSI